MTYEEDSRRVRREHTTETRLRSADVYEITAEIIELEDQRAELLEALENLLADAGVDVLEDAARSDPNNTNSSKRTVARFDEARAAIQRARGE